MKIGKSVDHAGSILPITHAIVEYHWEEFNFPLQFPRKSSEDKVMKYHYAIFVPQTWQCWSSEIIPSPKANILFVPFNWNAWRVWNVRKYLNHDETSGIFDHLSNIGKEMTNKFNSQPVDRLSQTNGTVRTGHVIFKRTKTHTHTTTLPSTHSKNSQFDLQSCSQYKHKRSKTSSSIDSSR